ncbi:hypothetical protein VNO77_08223 [Canavalia gladiata]|uniref:Uncharacterized protein n=1 Tax=Canavalia gladiata TaxID=3824 RepID=A0AAN9QWI4_CANGL
MFCGRRLHEPWLKKSENPRVALKEILPSFLQRRVGVGLGESDADSNRETCYAALLYPKGVGLLRGPNKCYRDRVHKEIHPITL